MALYYDNFESYAAGAVIPVGSFTDGTGTVIGTDNYVTSGSRSLFTVEAFTSAYFNCVGALQSSTTLYSAIKFNGNSAGLICQYLNGNDRTGPSDEIYALRMEQDNTISCLCAGTLGANSMDFSFHQDRWYWMQSNVTTTGVTVGTQTFLQVAFALGIEGTTVASATVLTSTPVNLIVSTSAQYNWIKFSNSTTLDEFTFDLLQPMNTYPNPGTPKARATTGLGEVIELVNTAAVRATTGLIELIITRPGWSVTEA